MSVVLPLCALAVLAWVVPWILGKVLPEGVGWLAVNGVASAVFLALAAALGFWWLYGAAGDAVLEVAPWHFLFLSAKAAIVWAPLMVLSLANLPKGWKEAVW